MIPGRRKKRQRESGFPLEKAKRLYASFDEAGQDISFQQFYKELQCLTDEKKMKRDLDQIQMRKHQEQTNRRMIERGLLYAN